MQKSQTKNVVLSNILITEKLAQRAPRPANWQAEVQAIQTLTRQMVSNSQTMLQSLVDVALELCQAGTAGVSLLEKTSTGEELFRWPVLAGALAEFVGGTAPRNFSHCGICIDGLPGVAESASPLLFSYPERYFTYLEKPNTPMVESLVLPLIAENKILGTIWIVTHDQQRHLDSEDLRVMTSLADFTATALLLSQRQTKQLLTVNTALATEMGERQQIEQKRDRFLAIGSDLQMITSSNGYFQWVSPTFKQILGWTSEELLSRPWTEFVHPDDLRASDSESLKFDNKIIAFENRYRHKDGSYRWLLWKAQPYLEEEVIYGAAVDITASKRLEAERQQAAIELREAHVQLESALAAGAVYTWRWNILTDQVVVNAAFANLFAVEPTGATSTGLPLKFFLKSMHPEDRPHVWNAIKQAIATGEEYAAEYRVLITNGEERWLTARGRVEYDGAGNPVSFPGALIDITDRKQAEESLRQLSAEIEQQLRKFDAVASSVPDFIYTFDLAGRFTYINQPLLDLLQKTASEALGKNFFELDYPSELAAQLQNQIQEVISTRQPLKDETPYTSAFGTRAYEYIFVPLFDASGSVEAVAGITRDITERKQIELEREQILQREQAAREAAERANQIKDEFLAVLSHELRSPLNPILGWARLLQSNKLDFSHQTEALRTIERNAKLQLQLIDDLLDISCIMQGKLSLTKTPISLTFVISAAVETVRLAAEAKQIQILLDLDPALALVSGDSGRLQQVIWNLLTNAVKFTPQGGQVTIELRYNQVAQIRVVDTGIGIKPQFLPHVFEYFRQEDSSTTRKFGGLGLGLAIVLQIVEMHGGTITAESLGENQGATFIVQLPLLHKEVPTVSVSQTQSGNLDELLANLDILVVDDDDDTREFQVFLLEQSGAKVTAVASGKEALKVLDQSLPDLLISDVGMTQMDGYQLIQQIRLRPSDRGGMIPAIALTAYARDFDSSKALQAGFHCHLTKPVDPELLVKEIVALLRHK